MRIAFNKCTVHRISNRGSSATCNPVYSIAGYLLGQSNETRDLGIITDNKLNFSSHISHISRKTHVRASLILRTFISRDPIILFLTKAFITYVVRPLLEYCTPIWSPHTVCNVNKTESCQRLFTKRIKVVYGLDYSQRLIFLCLETLNVRSIQYDLIMWSFVQL